ncbi:MAG: endonuclease MutS2, partial [Paludibacteraceae bacterium]|nr:endonuclease MutS2 [Paludibacteraceae bacterium]
MVYPGTFEQKIGFDKVRQWVGSLCICDMGRELVAGMNFSADASVIARRHRQTREFLRFCEEGGQFPTDGFYDVRPSLKRIQTEGTFLTETELFEMLRSLRNQAAIARSFAEKPADVYPELQGLAVQIGSFPDIIRQIDGLLDRFGHVKDEASPTLAEIRRERNRLSGSITKLLTDILHQARRDGYIEEDTQPTLREGRLVIPVSPVFKRKLGGIVHDASASGKTVFVEPTAVVEANNRIRILEADEKREIVRLLTVCTDFIRPQAENLSQAYRYLGYMDFIRAKALWARAVDAGFPEMVPQPCIYWKNARHPLLEATLRQQHRDIVPLDISLNDHDRILVISGPNAGGKSVCLKTVGLLQYGWQCGLPVPMLEESRMGLFQQILLDIGDEQSIENDLSTYSSHLSNMKYFLKHADAHSLLLIDEFGGGTEPLLGGAIAEAELKVFNSKGAYGVITTHYTNLKHYASNTEGLVSGAMLYDRHQMQPLFQLSIGNPGSSFAIEIARQIGLPESVIQDATDLVGSEHINYDKNLQDIV